MQEPPLEPWLFSRIALPKVWAGKALARLFAADASDFPPGTGESIELADLKGCETTVRAGPARGYTLRRLMNLHGREIIGGPWRDFPLAVKFLDTAEALSVQCHPADAPGKPGKSEAWIVLDARPGAVIYQALKPGLTRADFEKALAAGMPEATLNARAVNAGDYLYNPARMIHAIGPGLTLLEVQQSCDTTLRFFDWGRTGRELQLKEALATADFAAPPPPVVAAGSHEGLLELQKGPPFGVQSLRVKNACRFAKEWPGFTLFTCLEGDCELIVHGRGEIHTEHLRVADTLLVPAAFGEFEFFPRRPSWIIETYAV
ncbi:MAG: class I mannose-6-phosphate isomerase [Planctomycetes bacterium]|nr:class I mannose-6-phosphate isomerase [Planctomycetota bacterium]